MQNFLNEILLTAPCYAHVVHIFRRSEKTSMMRNATWTLSNLCRGKPPPPFEWVQNLVDTRRCAYSTACHYGSNLFVTLDIIRFSLLQLHTRISFDSDICQGFTCTWHASKPHLLFRLRGPNYIHVVHFSYTLHM